MMAEPRVQHTPDRQLLLDLAKSCPRLETLLLEHAHFVGGDVALNLISVVSVCSEDLNEMMRLRSKLLALDRRLLLVDVPAQVYDVLKITHLTRILEVRQA